MLSEQKKSIQTIISREFRSKNIDYIKELKNNLVADGKFSIDSFQALRVNPSCVGNLSDEELCLIAQAIAGIKPNALSVEDYFTPTDILQASTFFSEPTSSDELLLFRNAAMLGRNQWSAIASVKQIAMLKKYNLIRVDPNLQRQSVARRSSETEDILKRVYVNPRRVDEIATKIARDVYHYNTVRLNVMVNDGSVEPYFDVDNSMISIDGGNDIIIPDGHHRILAAEKAYYDNPSLSGLFESRFFQVVITYYSPKEVRDTISQEWNTQPVPKQHKSSMSSSAASTIINMIRSNEEADEVYTKAIVTTQAEVRAGVGFISHELFTRALDKYFHLSENSSKASLSSTASWLVKYYNFVTDKYSAVFANPKDSYNSNWIVSPWGWYGITCFASMVKGDSKWMEITDRAFDMVNWSDMSIITGSKSSVELNILKLFKEVCVRSVQQ